MTTNDDSIKKFVHDAYANALDRKPDSKTLTFWANAITSGNKSEGDLVTFLVTCSEYKMRVLSKFKSIWFELVSCDIDAHIFDSFFESMSTKTTGFITEKDIIKYIKFRPEYEQKVTNLINTMFSARYNREPTKDELCHFIAKFRPQDDDQGHNYNITMLESDIDELSKSSSPEQVSPAPLQQGSNDKTDTSVVIDTTSVLEDITKRYIHVCKERLATIDEGGFTEFMKNPEYMIDVYQRHKNPPPLTLDNEFVREFEDTFKRPIFVQEYAKYVHLKNNLALETLLQSHLKNFGDMRGVYDKYYCSELSEHEYVSKYLWDMNDPNFLEEFSKSIVLSETYVTKMKERITNRYSQTYDEQLDKVDVDYIFEKVQSARVGVHDVWLDEFLLFFKNETDEIIKRVFSLYMTIYERVPERNELFDKALYYRSASRKNEMFDKVDEVIERELMQCLEFHDIIKKRIKTIKPDVTVSGLFSILSLIIEKLPTIRITELDENIRICNLVLA
jgi:hypothetical protein